MIRKAIIVLLTLGAVGTGVLWADSHRVHRGRSSSPHVWVQALLYPPPGFEAEWSLGDRSVFFEARQGTIYLGLFRSRYRQVAIPFWSVYAVFAAYLTFAFIRGPVRRWRRRRKGLCVNCAYNLTGNVSGICPECGTKIERP